MDRDPESQRVMSLRLSKVLGDIGVTRHMVDRRRRTWLIKEKVYTIEVNILRDKNYTCYHVGSQSEGTTSLGMKSDVDMLVKINDHSIILEMSEWQFGGKGIFLMLKNEKTPPQHCNLQIIRTDLPLPFTQDMVVKSLECEVDMEGKVLLKNTVHDSLLTQTWGVEYIRQGPSRSGNKELDVVNAYHCPRVPEECQIFFQRPRPGHWPRPGILEQARGYGIFLVPQGHAESYDSSIEWRFSTSLTERLLMFDLNSSKVKTYTFLKILRKTFFKPIVGDRLSSFHFKTTLLSTIETYPPEIWRKQSLLQCIIYCLTTLRRWCKMNYCPHYTISGVDLFVGKLKKFELLRISVMLSDMIENIITYVVHINMDQVGDRMLVLNGNTLSQLQMRTRYENQEITVKYCLDSLLFELYSLPWKYVTQKTLPQLLVSVDQIIRDLISLRRNINKDTLHFARDVIGSGVKNLCGLLASIQASRCIELRQTISPDIYNLYQTSLVSNVTSSRLKFASMLYCTGQHEGAITVLNFTEGLLHEDVLPLCLSRRRQCRPTRNFLRKGLYLPVSEIIQDLVAICVVFLPRESYCVPKHLVYELYRTCTQADIQHRHPAYCDWMDCVTVDSIPFLYYLQYLTYREHGQHDKKLAALQKLCNYVNDDENQYGYKETAWNMLGHCWQLENKLDLAWQCFCESVWAYPQNNAARWHMAIILTKLHDGIWPLF
ncbi:uncharacterized protein LOC128206556 [Mya arenaria]|uniref:uncharacterized protein LOC128206556 n=1 Tax=Mya arenaria TaxID=6604 RepID=UPI0022E5B1DF|nr:uncharacterized protein LOC128206556 [Mya arenaria]